MFAEIITIGNELLSGQTLDSNAAWMASELNAAGFRVGRMVSVGDDAARIKSALDAALESGELVLLTGGLGPTSDDITKTTLAEYFHTEMIFDPLIYSHVEKLLASRGFDVNRLNQAQAEVPGNCQPLQNELGTAPGLWFETGDKVVVALPGVPYEMKALMEKEVLPRLKEKFKRHAVIHKTILTFGTYEARLAEILSGFESTLPPHIGLAYLPANGIIKLRLSCYCSESHGSHGELERYKKDMEKIVGPWVFGYDSDTLEAVVGRELRKLPATLSLAESCTGGKIASLITSVPGSSDYFRGGLVAYSNEVKIEKLGVSPRSLHDEGAVSRPVAEEMARGALSYFGTEFSLAVTGIAGPSGGSPEKPVGTVWIAAAGGGQVMSESHRYGNNRERNIIRSSYAALNLLRKLIISV